VLKNNFGPTDAEFESTHRYFVCSETMKSFTKKLEPNQLIPVDSPYSGKKTGYLAELCYWNADGTQKKTPTPVLLKTSIGQKGPTFCPECGRLVVGHNPLPGANSIAPPTEAEYKAKHAAKDERQR
jgi:hypothetical protein